MNDLGNGIVTIFNGFAGMLGLIASWWVFAAVVMAVSLTWLARIECDELDRQATKPDIGRH